MRRALARSLLTLIDVGVLVAALSLAFLVRFDWAPPWIMTKRLVMVGPYVVLLQYLVLRAFGVHRYAWRYIGLRESLRMGMAIGASALILLLGRLVVGVSHARYPLLAHALIPTGVILIDSVVAFLGVVGARVVRRLWAETSHRKHVQSRTATPKTATLLVGAGQAGLLVVKEIEGRPDIGVQPVGFVDDDPLKRGTSMHGVGVLGSISQLPEICQRTGVAQVLVTIADPDATLLRRILELADQAGVPAKLIPGMYEVLDGRVNLSRIRDVAIEDLLRRDPIVLEQEALDDLVRGRRVLVTGAGGSIGSELCRQLCRFSPKTLALVERAENSLFHIHRELTATHPELAVHPMVADVTDHARMTQVFTDRRPQLVLHAAAHKHVPMMEWNPGEAVKNNVFGTRVVASLAQSFKVERFVFVSTDKAVRPTSVMGASKRLAEMYLQSVADRSDTRFLVVRFGNVLGSAGSVVPLFREQIARGGPVTVTHPDMRRFFMTIPEACQLVLQAAAMGQGGEVFILDMGEAVRIVDLATDLIRLSGLRPHTDIEISFTGVRPGEKMFEELSTDAEHACKTRHPKILVGNQDVPSADALRGVLDRLERVIQSYQPSDVVGHLATVVPEFTPSAGSATEPKQARRPVAAAPPP